MNSPAAENGTCRWAQSRPASVSSVQKRRIVIGLVLGAVWSSSLHADQPQIPHIGVLVFPLKNSPYEAGFRDGLRERGYVEGNNIVIEWRRSTGAMDEQRLLVTDMTRENLAVIVVFSTVAARAALEATTTTPVVFSAADPVATGLAASLARPGRNGTGVSTVLADLTGKRLELLRVLAPRARRIACLINSSSPVGLLQFEAAENAGRALGVELVKLDARSDAELDAALREISHTAVDGILVTGESLFLANRTKLAAALHRTKLPAIFPTRDYFVDGVLMSYGPSLKETARKMAGYVDKVLKGAKPSELPIEQVSKYELIIDTRVAHELGVKVPQQLLLRADE